MAGGIAAAVPAALFVALAGTALHRHDLVARRRATSRGARPRRCCCWARSSCGSGRRSVPSIPTAACGALCYALAGWWSTLETGKRLVIGDAAGNIWVFGIAVRHRGHARLVPAVPAPHRLGPAPRRGHFRADTSRPAPPGDMPIFRVARVGTMALCPAAAAGARDMSILHRWTCLLPCSGAGTCPSALVPVSRSGLPAECTVFHIARDPDFQAAAYGSTMGEWPTSSRCSRNTTASPAPNTLPPRASPTSSSSPRWPREPCPGWPAASTPCPVPTRS